MQIILNDSYWQASTRISSKLDEKIDIHIRTKDEEWHPGESYWMEGISPKGEKDKLGREIHLTENGTPFVLFKRAGSVSRFATFIVDHPETSDAFDFQDGQTLTYSQRRSSAYAWCLKRQS